MLSCTSSGVERNTAIYAPDRHFIKPVLAQAHERQQQRDDRQRDGHDRQQQRILNALYEKTGHI